MNWMILDAVAAAAVLLAVFHGRRQGFVAMALMLVGLTLSFWGAHVLAQPTAQWVYDNHLQQRLVVYVDEKIEETGIDEAAGEVNQLLENITGEDSPLGLLKALKNNAAQLLEGLDVSMGTHEGEVIPFPEEESPEISHNRLQQLMEEGATMAEAVEETLLRPLAFAILEMIAFLALFILFSLAVKLIIRLSRIVNYLPLLRSCNRFLGGLCGLAEGLILVYIAGIFLRLLAATAGPDSFVTMELLQDTILLKSIIFVLG